MKNKNEKIEYVDYKIGFPHVVTIRKEKKEYSGEGRNITDAVIKAVKEATGIYGKIIENKSNFTEAIMKVEFKEKEFTGNIQAEDKDPLYLKIEAYIDAYNQFAESN